MPTPPKPTALKLLQGTHRADRANPNEPQVEPCTIPRPRWLRGEARREWNRLAPQLARAGVLTEMDRSALIGLCEMWARWREAEGILDKEGLIRDGRRHPASTIAAKCYDQWRAMLAEFGLTPSSRSRVSAVPVAQPKKGSLASFTRARK